METAGVGPQVSKVVARKRVKNAHRKHCVANGYVSLRQWVKSYEPISEHDDTPKHIEAWQTNKALG